MMKTGTTEKRKWSEEELTILRENYPKVGLKVTAMLPNRTYNSVRGMVSCMKLTRKENGRNPWTDEEIEILKQWYPIDPKEAARRIPFHTEGSISVKASQLGFTKKEEKEEAPWTEEEEDALRIWFPVSMQEAEKHITAHPRNSIQAKAVQLGLKETVSVDDTGDKARQVRKWTEQEDEIIRMFYPDEGPNVHQRLEGRTSSACVIRASVLGITYAKNDSRYWTKEEDELLRKNWGTEGLRVVSRLKDRSELSCVVRARNLGLENPPKGELWMLEDLALFMYYFPKEKFAVMNRMSGTHTSLSCEKMAKYLGYLPAEGPRESWTKGEDQIIENYYPKEKAEVCRMLPKRTRNASMARGRNYLKTPSEAAFTAEKKQSFQTKRWTEEEVGLLKKYYPTEGRDVIKRFPGRKLGDIQQKAQYLQVKEESRKNFYWTAAEIETLLAYYPSEGRNVCSRIPGRTGNACAMKYESLAAEKTRKRARKRWTPEEVEVLKKYYPTEGTDVAKRLPGWSEKKCSEKALLLGMKKYKKQPKEPRKLSEFFDVAEELKTSPIRGICIA